MQVYDLGRGNSEFALAPSLETWVLNTALQGFGIKEQVERIRVLYQ